MSTYYRPSFRTVKTNDVVPFIKEFSVLWETELKTSNYNKVW